MIIEEIIPHRIRDLLNACLDQHGTIRRLIVEADAGFQTSKLRILLGSRKWPVAVNPNLIVDANSVEDQMARGEAILDKLVTTPLSGRKLLDFGAGLGYVGRVAENRGATVVNYDIQASPGVTDDWDAVLSRAPYDVVLVYDVLDHTREEHPIECLRRIRDVVSPQGTVFVRCHPWCSRTGTHNYAKLNKAYLHYFFNEEELEEMGAPGIWTRKITHPLAVYSDWALKGGFQTVSHNVEREKIEDFWTNEPLLRNIIQDHWKDSYEEKLALGEKFPTYQMEQSWHDMVLKIN